MIMVDSGCGGLHPKSEMHDQGDRKSTVIMGGWGRG